MNFRNALLLVVGAVLALALQGPLQSWISAFTNQGDAAPAAAMPAVNSNAKPAAKPSAKQSASAPATGPVADPLPGYAPAESRRNALVAATEIAAPAVVSIAVTRSAVVRYRNPFYNDPFFEFFGSQYRREEFSSMGSGVIVSAQGHILTNSHVVGGRQGGKLEKVLVTLGDERSFAAVLVGEDPDNDLAVLKISGKDLPVARIQGNPDNLIAEWVVAIGNPFGYLIGDSRATVTVGVISAVKRSFSSGSGLHYHNMIQTDAAINPGNSGGPLVNSRGEVIGINTFIFTGGGESQGSIGLGFAIPIQKAMLVKDELVRYGRIRDFTTGIYAAPALGRTAQGIVGVVVAEVEKGSPGDKAGLKRGDIIQTVAGKKLNDVRDIQDIFKLFQVGEKVDLEFIRDENRIRTHLILEEKR